MALKGSSTFCHLVSDNWTINAWW